MPFYVKKYFFFANHIFIITLLIILYRFRGGKEGKKGGGGPMPACPPDSIFAGTKCYFTSLITTGDIVEANTYCVVSERPVNIVAQTVSWAVYIQRV